MYTNSFTHISCRPLQYVSTQSWKQHTLG